MHTVAHRLITDQVLHVATSYERVLRRILNPVGEGNRSNAAVLAPALVVFVQSGAMRTLSP